MSFWDWYRRSQDQASLQNIPLVELDWLVMGLTGIERLSLRLGEASVSNDQIIELEQLWRKRIETRTPVQYLLGKVNWLNFELNVSPAVLIPRPETELLIDIAVSLIPNPSILVDLGTGSGAIALGLATAFPHSLVHAVDYSAVALAIAQGNAEKYQLSDRIQFHQGHWFEPLTDLRSQITAMIANPPYIPTSEVERLAPEVTNHEPHLALDGGIDGLDCLRYLIDTAPQYLVNGGYWLVEIMAGQSQIVRSLLKTNGNYESIKIHKDYAGIERFVSAIKC
jgi:release factor glutamine methyltransferase